VATRPVRIYPLESVAALASVHPAAGAMPAVEPIKVAKPLG
jgi:hypothetical protein